MSRQLYSSIKSRAANKLKKLRGDSVCKIPVFLYHRVAEEKADPQLLCVSPQNFSDQLQVLQREFKLISLQQFVLGLESGNLPEKAAVITFDDGYVDNLTNAKPLLEKHEAPATVFVTTGNMDQHHEFWWDELERLLLLPNTLPESLTFQIGQETISSDLSNAATYTVEMHQANSAWNILESENPTPRHALYRELNLRYSQMSGSAIQASLQTLQAATGLGDIGRSTHRTLNSEELVQLAQGGLVEIGAHTVTHPLLASISVGEQRFEIETSQKKLEALLQAPIKSFSYPFGTKSSYQKETIQLVRELGFNCACSNFPGLGSKLCERFEIPRILVRNWNGDEFLKEIEACLWDSN